MTPGFGVAPEVWMRVGRAIGDDVAVELADGVDAFCRAMGGQPFGGDDLGQMLFEGDPAAGAGFVQRRDGLLEDLPAAVNVLRGMGAGLVDSGGRYVEADGSIVDELGGRRGPAPGPMAQPGQAPGRGEYRLPPVTGGIPSAVSPPGIWLQALWVFETIGLGFAWPDGDLRGVAQLRDAATAMAAVVDEVARVVADHVGRVTDSGFGAATEAFVSAARVVHGEGGLLADVKDRCEELASYCQSSLTAIVKARWQCVASAVFVVGLTIMASVYGPLLEAAMASLIRLEGLALWITLRIIREAAMGLVFSGGLDGIDQLFRWDGFNAGELAGALWQGAFAGGLMGGAHVGLPALLRRAPALTRLADAMKSPGFAGMVSRFITGGTVATAAMATTSKISGHGWDWQHALEGGFGMALIGVGGEALTSVRNGLRSSWADRISDAARDRRSGGSLDRAQSTGSAGDQRRPTAFPQPPDAVGDWREQAKRDSAWIREVDPGIRRLLDELDTMSPEVRDQWQHSEKAQEVVRLIPADVRNDPRNRVLVDEAAGAGAFMLDHVDAEYGRADSPRVHLGTHLPESLYTYHNGDHTRSVARDSLGYIERIRRLAPNTHPYTDTKVIDSMLGGLGHDLVQGHGRGVDERISAAVTDTVMRHLMPETYTAARGRYVVNSEMATAFNEKTKAQDVDPARGDIEGQTAISVGDIFLNGPDSPSAGARLAIEDLAKPEKLGSEFMQRIRDAGLDPHTAPVMDIMKAIESDPVLRSAFVGHAKGQQWFFTYQRPTDVIIHAEFPGRIDNIMVLKKLVPMLEDGQVTVPEYYTLLCEYGRGSLMMGDFDPRLKDYRINGLDAYHLH